MYGLSDDVEFLAGRFIEDVRLREYQLDLFLEGGHRLTIEGDVTLANSRFAAPESVLHERLRGRRIDKAEVIDGRDLALTLDDGECVVVHDSNEEFESFTIAGPGVTIVV